MLPGAPTIPDEAAGREGTDALHSVEGYAQEDPHESDSEGSTIIDVEEMKRIVHQSLQKPVYDVKDFYVTEGIWQIIARSAYFDNTTLAVITFNALWISIDTDGNFAATILEAKPVYQIAEYFFCIYFSFEWFVRYKSFRRKRDGMKDAWFVFDTTLVFMMVFETWIMNVVLVATGTGVSAGGAASLLRLLRLLRLSRLARMLRSMPELMILIRGMVASTRSVFFTLCLLFIIMYVFAILFKQLTANSLVGQIYFYTIPDALYTLLLTGTFLDSLFVVVNDLGAESLGGSYMLAGMFFLFILAAALTVMNMLIGVLCEVVAGVSQAETEESNISFVKDKMGKIMDEIDTNGDGTISKEEFGKIMENVEAITALQDVGVDPVGLVDFQDYIFEGGDDVVFQKGERVMLQDGRQGIVDTIPHGDGLVCFRIKLDEGRPPESPFAMVSKSRLYKVLQSGTHVSVDGRMGVTEGDPNGNGEYKVIFSDGDCPKMLMTPAEDLREEKEVEISRDDFLDIVLKFRGCNNATIRDMVDLRKVINTKMIGIEERLLDYGLFDANPTGGKAVAPVGLHPSLVHPQEKAASGSLSARDCAARLEQALTKALSMLRHLEAVLAEDGSRRGSRTSEASADATETSPGSLRRAGDAGDASEPGIWNNGEGSFRAPAESRPKPPQQPLPPELELSGIGHDAGDGQSLAAGQEDGRGDACRVLLGLEELSVHVLEWINSLRQAMPPAQIGRGLSSPGTHEFRKLRVLLARLEGLFLTSWPSELQHVFRSLPAEASSYSTAEESRAAPHGLAGLDGLLQPRLSELREHLRRLPA